jgi:hypothetical protein
VCVVRQKSHHKNKICTSVHSNLPKIGKLPQEKNPEKPRRHNDVGTLGARCVPANSTEFAQNEDAVSI